MLPSAPTLTLSILPLPYTPSPPPYHFPDLSSFLCLKCSMYIVFICNSHSFIVSNQLKQPTLVKRVQSTCKLWFFYLYYLVLCSWTNIWICLFVSCISMNNLFCIFLDPISCFLYSVMYLAPYFCVLCLCTKFWLYFVLHVLVLKQIWTLFNFLDTQRLFWNSKSITEVFKPGGPCGFLLLKMYLLFLWWFAML